MGSAAERASSRCQIKKGSDGATPRFLDVRVGLKPWLGLPILGSRLSCPSLPPGPRALWTQHRSWGLTSSTMCGQGFGDFSEAASADLAFPAIQAGPIPDRPEADCTAEGGPAGRSRPRSQSAFPSPRRGSIWVCPRVCLRVRVRFSLPHALQPGPPLGPCGRGRHTCRAPHTTQPPTHSRLFSRQQRCLALLAGF